MSGMASTATGLRGKPAEIPIERRDHDAPRDHEDHDEGHDQLLLQAEPYHPVQKRGLLTGSGEVEGDSLTGMTSVGPGAGSGRNRLDHFAAGWHGLAEVGLRTRSSFCSQVAPRFSNAMEQRRS